DYFCSSFAGYNTYYIF
nr:immunoglobulin light chain junction region [Macaca mulatta]